MPRVRSRAGSTHVCPQTGCNKAFKRLDHLQRHALNHSYQGKSCQRCGAYFRRLDLLERHMNRHKQKDDEAGGEGLGIVQTRKRLWCDAEGNFVQKQPCLVKPIFRREAVHAVAPSSKDWTLTDADFVGLSMPSLASYESDIFLQNQGMIFPGDSHSLDSWLDNVIVGNSVVDDSILEQFCANRLFDANHQIMDDDLNLMSTSK